MCVRVCVCVTDQVLTRHSYVPYFTMSSDCMTRKVQYSNYDLLQGLASGLQIKQLSSITCRLRCVCVSVQKHTDKLSRGCRSTLSTLRGEHRSRIYCSLHSGVSSSLSVLDGGTVRKLPIAVLKQTKTNQ